MVGAAFSGKTAITENLAKAMSDLKGQGDFVNVKIGKLNPKSVTAD
jgi:hypothetical protein